MKRLFLLPFLLALCCPLLGQDLKLEVKGDVKTVKVDKVIIVQEDRTVVSAPPFSVVAPSGGMLYHWSYPTTAVVVDRGDTLEVKSFPNGVFTANVKVTTVDWDAKKFLTKFGELSVNVGGIAPTPKPDPVDPKPDPPSPAPIPVAGFRMLVVYDSTNGKPNLTPKQLDELHGAELAEYMNAKAVKVNGTPEWRVWDKETRLTNASELWRQAMGRTRTKHPWVIISDGTRGYEGPYPDSGVLGLARQFGN
jgi:hypothetical protein